MTEERQENPYANPYGTPQTEINTASVGSGSGEFPSRPWLTIWLQPRATIQQIIDSDPRRHVLFIMLLAGLVQGLHNVGATQLGDLTDSLAIRIVVSILFGILGTLLGLLLGAVLLTWTGSWLGGRGSTENVRAALAWASVPGIWGGWLFVAKLAALGTGAFSAEEPTVPHLLTIWWLIEIGKFTIAIWAFFVFLKCLGQAQGFSAWKGFGNALLAGMVIFVPIVGLAFIAVMIVAW